MVDYGYKEGFVIRGGGCLLENYIELAMKPEVTFVTDTCANAKGYETLAEKKHEDGEQV